MAREISRKGKIGQPPGTVIHTGRHKPELKISFFDYTESTLTVHETAKVEECLSFENKQTVSWIDIQGVHDIETIKKIGEHFRLHSLLLEDIANTDQRPKMEDYEGYLFVVLKALSHDTDKHTTLPQQISLVIGPAYVLSFQESDRDVFAIVKERIKQGKGKIRKMGADYLAYVLMDLVVDRYFEVLERFGEKIENLEEDIIHSLTTETVDLLHHLKREMIYLRRSVWPVREVLSGLQRNDSVLIRKSTKTYLRDVYDHSIQVIDTIETYRDLLAGMLDIYLSSMSNRMNEVMKVLTLIATIFIPLTFVTGIYGMNFAFMPFLSDPHGFWYIIIGMAVLGAVMALYFKRRGWA
ncbi:TPA: magnesium/cobalt transporter CorA [Candidatus Woesearchaeota archaeon]|nr:magnesium/cobalt transporter CorA [Candidatus Woesearchaeota archaeon]